jgi:hypothetical protein
MKGISKIEKETLPAKVEFLSFESATIVLEKKLLDLEK